MTPGDAAPAPAQSAKPAGPWEPFEIEMAAAAEMANPWHRRPVRGMRYTVAGFWDGGKTWKVRFSPPAPGEWSYTAPSPDPPFAKKGVPFERSRQVIGRPRHRALTTHGERSPCSRGPPPLRVVSIDLGTRD